MPRWISLYDAVFGAGVDGDTVLFVAGGCDAGLAGAAAVELGLDIGLGERERGGGALMSKWKFRFGLLAAGRLG